MPPVIADRLPPAIFQVSKYINLKTFAIIAVYMTYITPEVITLLCFLLLGVSHSISLAQVY